MKQNCGIQKLKHAAIALGVAASTISFGETIPHDYSRADDNGSVFLDFSTFGSYSISQLSFTFTDHIANSAGTNGIGTATAIPEFGASSDHTANQYYTLGEQCDAQGGIGGFGHASVDVTATIVATNTSSSNVEFVLEALVQNSETAWLPPSGVFNSFASGSGYGYDSLGNVSAYTSGSVAVASSPVVSPSPTVSATGAGNFSNSDFAMIYPGVPGGYLESNAEAGHDSIITLAPGETDTIYTGIEGPLQAGLPSNAVPGPSAAIALLAGWASCSRSRRRK